MKDKKFTAIYRTCVQISPDDFKDVAHTKSFDYTASMQDVMDWLEKFGIKNVDVNSVTFAAHDD